ncbi:MAG: glycoside hydrolase family 5 protein, partial [Lachnospiraceae bacterium]|nr:glycoside hydrolase family 5 protein [Lachnospiraceae bacterium]
GDYHSKDEKDYDFNWWGGNLRGVKDYPIDLGKYQSQLIYSPHDYGPKVYKQPWFEKSFDFDSLMKDCWRDNWFYIYEDEIAPLLIGEWGGFMNEKDNLKWMTYCRELIAKYHLNHTFWCFNANSGDTGGLVKDDFTTWDHEKYEFVKEVLWQKDGKFVSLDHDIPLGTAGNGISLSAYYK